MRLAIATLVCGPSIALVCGASIAHANDDAASDLGVTIGPTFEVVPAGTLAVDAVAMTYDEGLGSAYAWGFLGECRVHPLVGVGIAPRFVIPVRPASRSLGQAGGTQVDLRARVSVGTDVSPAFRVQGFAMGGYSITNRLVADLNRRYHSASGVVGGLGAGVIYELAPRILVAGEISCQLGSSVGVADGTEATVTTGMLGLGIALLTPL